MQARDILNNYVVCCTPETNLGDVAQMMVQHDCGAIPVVQSLEENRPVGIVTDRDITCRTVAQALNPLDCMAGEIMSSPLVTADPQSSIEECVQLMEKYQVRRLPIVSTSGTLLGIISQADIAQIGPPAEAAELVQEISLPATSASRVPSVTYAS